MKKKKIEAFENFEVEPSSEVWAKIESNLPPAKKRRRFLWIFPLLLIIIGGGFLITKEMKLVSSSNEKEFVPSKKSESSSEIKNTNRVNANDDVQLKNEIHPASNTIPPEENKISRHSKNLSAHVNNKTVNDDEVINLARSDESEVYSTMNNVEVSDEELSILEIINFIPAGTTKEKDVIGKNIPEVKTKSLSRWTLFAGAGISYANSHDNTMTAIEPSQNEIKGIKDLYFNIGAGYDLNHRLKLTAGLMFLKAGQEQSSLTQIYVHGGPPDPNNTYTFATANGNLSGPGSDFNTAYYGTPDSLLFPLSTQLIPNPDTVEEKYFTLRQEFTYIEIPITIIYKPIERRFTPYVGVSLTTGYLLKQKLELNDLRINYEYEGGLSDFLFSAGIVAGVEYRLSRTINIQLNGFYQEGLNSVIRESSWKPYVAGVGLGMSYRLYKN